MSMKGGRTMNGRTQVLRYTALNHCMQSSIPKRKARKSLVQSAMKTLQLVYLKLLS